MKIGNLLLGTLAVIFALSAFAGRSNPPSPYLDAPNRTTNDTIPLKDRTDNAINSGSSNPFDLSDPPTITKEVEYDPETNRYLIIERIGDDYYRAPTYMTFEEYLEYRDQEQQNEFFRELGDESRASANGGRLRDRLGKVIGIDPNNPLGNVNIKESLADRLFGGTEVEINPQGNIDLTFGVDYSYLENPILPIRSRRNGGFDFDMNIQMNVEGKIGDKLNLNTNYNTQATFDFDNQLKLGYASDAFTEDDIIKTIEAGNVSLPLKGTLIQGAQSLFGLKTQLQFGRLYLTMVASQQKSEREEIQIKGGSQLSQFEVFADEYDENRHFLLSHFNRANFDESLSNLPQIKGLFNIEQIDVWITNDRNVTAREGEPGPRDIVALADLGEGNISINNNAVLTSPNRVQPNPAAARDITRQIILPSNDANDLYDNLIADKSNRRIEQAVANLKGNLRLQQGKDFEKVSARRLREGSEYTINQQLGFISVNINLQPDQVLAVAYQYSYNGRTFKVGELFNDEPSTSSDSSQSVLFVKLLKGTTPNVKLPAWDLMMKNFYNIGAYQVDRKDFKLDIYYEDPGIGKTANDPGRGRKRFLPSSNLEGVPLTRVFNLDELNVQGDPGRDGVFDFVPELTIFPRTGRIMFPVLEPFGSHLARAITDDQDSVYVYQQLYDSTVIQAREIAEKNRFSIRGEYRTSISSEISLGAFNIPRGSVIVKAGGTILKENVDYEIDYNIGRVKILNDAYLSSGIPISVSFEDNTLFGFQTKTLLGFRADYKFNDNFNVGATFLKLFERPFTPKVNIGDDPINNNIYGFDVNYSGDAPWLTRIVDKIPLIDTKAPSSITLAAEAALLKPGHSRAINEERGQDKGGVVYLDDFEGSTSSIDLRQPTNAWVLASVPQDDPDILNPLFPEADLINDIRYGANRGLMNWFRIDPQFYRDRQQAAEITDPYTSLIAQTELFPNRQLTPDQFNNVLPFDLVYYPNERGPYNFDQPGGYSGISAGLDELGQLNAPETRWGGIMRSLNINNFEQSNVEFIEFWLLSPFLDAGPETVANREGNLYIDLGNISEDILRDSRRFYENGLPGPSNPDRRTENSVWAQVPLAQQVINAFDTDPVARELQDVGLDGFDNDGERVHFQTWLNNIQASTINGSIKSQIQNDPANDDFVGFLDGRFESDEYLQTRYRNFNNTQGNSQPSNGQVLNSSTNIPDVEDLDNDYTLNETEAYFRYNIPIEPNGADGRMQINEFITDERVTENGRIWYRFRIPLNDPTIRKSIGGIQDLRSVRFIRLFLTDFKAPVTLRFGQFELVRNQWRVYRQDLSDVVSDLNTTVDINAVNIEENSSRCPFNYVLPPGIAREQSISAFTALQNEQALSVQVNNLAGGDARGVYKTLNLDLRNYERIKMAVHGERVGYEECRDDDDEINCGAAPLENGDLTVFIRLGTDFKENYYEYEIPLTLSSYDTLLLRNLIPEPGQSASPAYVDEIWRAQNNFDFPLEWLKEAKVARNTSNAQLTEVFEFLPTGLPIGHRIKMRGNPNLGYVKTIMIGVRNPNTGATASRCVEIWANELRLTGLNEQGGYAALGRMDLQLADLGSVSVAGNYSSIGYGALDQKLAERALDETKGFDVAGNFELSRFLPEQWALRLPLYAAYSKTIISPKFDPYDLDIPLSEKIANADTEVEKSEIKELAQNVTEIKTVNLNNIRKERTGDGTPLPWDISNFTLSYGHTETEKRDPLIEYDRIEGDQASLDYGFSFPSKPIEPFKKLPESEWLKFLRDFNFNPIPNTIAFSTAMNRETAETRYRFTDLSPVFSTFYNKQFTWDRNFTFNWDLAKSLKFNFNSTGFAVIDEPNESRLREENQNWSETQVKQYIRDSIWAGISDLGRPKNYTHNLALNFTVPTKSLPYLDWITLRAQYNATYGWTAAALNTESLGNIIQNSQKRQITGDFNFDRLYDEWGYLKQINRPVSQRPGAKRPAANSDTKTPKEGKEGEKEKKEREPSKTERAIIRPLLLVRKGRLSYSEQYATLLPGFSPTTRVLGLSDGFEAPGLNFVAGWQPSIRTLDQKNYYSAEDWLHEISNARGGASWVSSDVFLNQQVAQQYNQTIDATLNLEPIPDFRIDLTANRSFIENHTQYYKDTLDDGINDWIHAVPRNVGSLNLSYFALNTFFQDGKGEIINLFRTFERNRLEASDILGQGIHGDSIQAQQGYTQGYGRVQQDVLIASFMAAYQGKTITEVGVQTDYVRGNLFKQMPFPNWRLTYNGLSKLPLFKTWFQSINISHGYSSKLQINTFNTDLDYLQTNGGLSPNTQDFYSQLEIPEIVIQEAFSPLLGVDIRTQNDMSINFSFTKSRTLAMSFVSYQLAETQQQDYTFGFGWKMQEVNIGFLQNMVGNNPKNKKATSSGEPDNLLKKVTKGRGGASAANVGDLDIKIDFSWRDNITFNHILDQNIIEPTRGTRQISFSPSAQYQLHDQLALRLFFDYNRTVPKVSTSFPITNTSGGVVLRFSLN